MAGLLRISEAFALAFHAMAHVVNSNPDQPVSANELARTFRVSEAHLAKVLQRLTRAGLLDSRRGPRGGFLLAKPAEEISLLDIHHAVDGPLNASTCLLSETLCEDGSCIMEKLLRNVYTLVRRNLENTKLADIAGQVRPRVSAESA